MDVSFNPPPTDRRPPWSHPTCCHSLPLAGRISHHAGVPHALQNVGTMRAFLAVLLAIALSAASGFVAHAPRAMRATTVMSAEAQDSRRSFVSKALSVAAFAPLAAKADIDYEGIKFLGGGDQIDLNNANVRAYLRLPGMYPTIAGKIASNGSPLKSVGDVYGIKGLTEKEKAVIKSYESKGKFVVLDPKPEYYIDRFNNGLYR